MKSKKNRKQIKDSGYHLDSRNKHNSRLFQIKFDVLANDISCFCNKTQPSKETTPRNILNIQRPKKLSDDIQKLQLSSHQQNNQLKKQKPRSDQLDLIRQSSNPILTMIEQKGIRYQWNEDDLAHDKGSKNESKSESQDSDSIWSVFDNSFQKSYASTTDYQVFQNSTIYWQNRKISQGNVENNPYAVLLDYICYDWRTTLMIRNIPNKYTVGQLALQIDSQHANTYDFLYLPCDLKNQCNVGYGFINFVDTKYLESFYLKFNQYIWKKYRSQKICSLTYARLQGLNELIQHFSNSKVLYQKQKKYRPIIKMDQIHKMVLQQQKK